MTNRIHTEDIEEARDAEVITPPPPTRDAEVITPPPPPTEDISSKTAPVRPAPPAPAEGRANVELLLPADRRDHLKAAWVEVQSAFIDEPADSVRRADALVKDVLKSVSERFEAVRRDLENEWSRGGEAASTESLRLAIRRYRTLFDRLLGI
jgi:uncharacterized protein (DUF2236 family)